MSLLQVAASSSCGLRRDRIGHIGKRRYAGFDQVAVARAESERLIIVQTVFSRWRVR
jgi:hypothetical protein